jgi:zinc protease
VTLESAQLIRSILQDYGATFTEADLQTTKSFLIKSNARAFETAEARLAMLDNISKYGWKDDYIREREAVVRNMTISRIRTLSGRYLDPARMVWLVVGDAQSQLPRLRELGFGEPVVVK